MAQYIVLNENKVSRWLLGMADIVEDSGISVDVKKKLLKGLCSFEEVIDYELSTQE